MIIAEEPTRGTNNNNTKRRRQGPNHTLHNFDVLINLEGSSSSMVKILWDVSHPYYFMFQASLAFII